jgi:hypothetical protein
MIIRATKNDYGIDITYTVTDINGTPLDISTSSSRRLQVGRYGEATKLIDATMTFVTDGVNGQLKYTIGANDLLTTGYYDAEIELLYTAGKRTTRMFTLQIMEAL